MLYHYYLSTNSARGYIDFMPERAANLQHVQHTVGYPAALMRNLSGAAMELAGEKGLRLDIIHQPLDGSVSGLIIPERSAALFNTPCWLDRGRHVDNLLEDEARDKLQKLLQSAYETYAAAYTLHEEWEHVYISSMDFPALNQMIDTFIHTLTGDKKSELPGARTNALAGASTPDGYIDYMTNLTMNLPHRYFLKGRPGTGKSTFLKKITDAAQTAGMNIEVYRRAFDPQKLDMLILRDQGIAIFDSTSPHEYFPVRAGDEIIDIYSAAVSPGTDARFAAQIGMIAAQYQIKMQDAAHLLGEAKVIADGMDQRLRKGLDPCRMALATEQILNMLFSQT